MLLVAASIRENVSPHLALTMLGPEHTCGSLWLTACGLHVTACHSKVLKVLEVSEVRRDSQGLSVGFTAVMRGSALMCICGFLQVTLPVFVCKLHSKQNLKLVSHKNWVH